MFQQNHSTDERTPQDEARGVNLSDAAQQLADSLTRRDFNPPVLPKGFADRFETHIVLGVAAELSKHLYENRNDNGTVRVIVDLDDYLNQVIDGYIHEYDNRTERGRPGRFNNPTNPDSIIFYNCGLRTIMDKIGIDPCTATVFVSDIGRHRRFKIEIDVELQRLAMNVDRYVAECRAKEQLAVEQQRSETLYKWVEELVTIQRNSKQIEFLVEIQSDLKILTGYAKDVMGEFENVKTKLEALWIATRRKAKGKNKTDATK